MGITDILVIGGGIIGASVAYGVAERGVRVALLDQGGSAPNASRGNFGLAWVQGKGLEMPRYAEWSLEAAQAWPEFATHLREQTGISTDYLRPGSFEVCLGEKAWKAREASIVQMRRESATGTCDCEMLDRQAMRERIPKLRLGEAVSGASFSPHDGHLNSLALLTALLAANQKIGVVHHPEQPVKSVSFQKGSFEVRTSTKHFSAQKVVLACGLGIKPLVRQVGLEIPIRPQRGQILVTERTHPLLEQPFVTIRQTQEGSFLFGASHEEVGFDTGTTLEEMRRLAGHAVQVFPELARLQLVRCWGALRILTPDTKPVYVESESCPGAFVVTSHSGITLAPLHAQRLSEWIVEGVAPDGFEQFHPRRFDA